MRYTWPLGIVVAVTMMSPLNGQDGPYHAGEEIAIGGEGGWDYLTMDAPAHRLHVSHATQVVIVDTQSKALAGTFRVLTYQMK